MKNLIAPGSYDLEAGDKISSYTTGIATEGFLNFGYFGVIFVSFISALITTACWMVIKRAQSAVGITLGAVLLVRSAGLVNSEFYGTFIHIFIILAFFITYRFLVWFVRAGTGRAIGVI